MQESLVEELSAMFFVCSDRLLEPVHQLRGGLPVVIRILSFVEGFPIGIPPRKGYRYHFQRTFQVLFLILLFPKAVSVELVSRERGAPQMLFSDIVHFNASVDKPDTLSGKQRNGLSPVKDAVVLCDRDFVDAFILVNEEPQRFQLQGAHEHDLGLKMDRQSIRSGRKNYACYPLRDMKA
jgi:hypothetical protein